jgi:hypothetical protein
MNAKLPAREEYYRPARARELREKAARLEQWSYLCAVPLVILFAPVVSVAVWLDLWWLRALGTGSAFVIAMLIPSVLPKRAERLRKDAEALEAGHQVRYGALPRRGETDAGHY